MAGLPNLAATLGGWSARHRLTAVGAALALVMVAMLAGSAVGQVTMTQAEYAVLLPPVMALLGDRNWYLPRWLARFTADGARPYLPAGPLPPEGPCQPDGPHPETATGGRPWIHSSS